MKNGFEIIDAHCHIYPAKIAAAASAHTGEFYSIPMAFDGTVESLLEEGDGAGIDRYLVQSVAVTAKQVRSINRYIAGEVEKSGGKFIGFGTLHPESEDLEGDLEELISLGLRGVKLHPDMQNFKIDDYRYLKMYELCEGRLPMLIHMGDARSDFSHPKRLRAVMEIYDGLTVIAAHFGGYTMWEEASHILAGMPNLYTDCSSSFFALDDRTAVEIIRRYGADRVLFGTDYPMWRAEDEIGHLLSLGLTEDECSAIFAGNVRRLLEI